jgi:phytanoyl-CoA hydroxylase
MFRVTGSPAFARIFGKGRLGHWRRAAAIIVRALQGARARRRSLIVPTAPVERFVGPEVYSNPIQHVRIKPPERLIADLPGYRGATVARTDWHQDQGVHLPEADDTDILTVWIPVLDATLENGCLCVLPRSQRGGLQPHCGGAIPERLRPGRPLPLPIRRGGVLFLHHRTMHASLANRSDAVRWSFDLRYQPTGRPTGRPQFPGFVARSRVRPESALADWRAWAALWEEARRRLSATEVGPMRRWTGDEPACA